jgi:hypothetical protein
LRDVGGRIWILFRATQLFALLKMGDEYSTPPHYRKLPISKESYWESLTNIRLKPCGKPQQSKMKACLCFL